MSLKETNQFEKIMEEIKYLVNWYENKHLDQASTRVFLASGDSFKYKITQDSIAHMLGIKTDFLSNCNMFNTTKSYELVKELINNDYRISEKIKKDEIKLSDIFSKHIHHKLDIFKSNISINLENTLFVCKYNREKVINYGGTPRNCDYIIVKELDDGQILELDVVKSGKYVKPVSSRMYENEIDAKDSFEDLLRYQDVSILTSLIYDADYYDEGNKVFLNEAKKSSKLQQLENFSLRYNCNINTTGDCKYYYKKSIKGRNDGRNNYDIYDKIINCILDGEIITEHALGILKSEISEQTRNLINAINDKLMLGNNNPDNERSYSSLEEMVNRLTEANKVFMEENKQLKAEKENLIDENRILKNDVAKTKVLINTFKSAIDDYEEVK